MSQKIFPNEFKLLDLDNKFEKIVYIVEKKEERKNRLNLEAQNKIGNSKVENINNINNSGSLFVKDFEIKYLRKEDIIKPHICDFKPLPENINPLLTQQFDLYQKRFIDLKNIINTGENDYNIFSLDFD